MAKCEKGLRSNPENTNLYVNFSNSINLVVVERGTEGGGGGGGRESHSGFRPQGVGTTGWCQFYWRQGHNEKWRLGWPPAQKGSQWIQMITNKLGLWTKQEYCSVS